MTQYCMHVRLHGCCHLHECVGLCHCVRDRTATFSFFWSESGPEQRCKVGPIVPRWTGHAQRKGKSKTETELTFVDTSKQVRSCFILPIFCAPSGLESRQARQRSEEVQRKSQRNGILQSESSGNRGLLQSTLRFTITNYSNHIIGCNRPKSFRNCERTTTCCLRQSARWRSSWQQQTNAQKTWWKTSSKLNCSWRRCPMWVDTFCTLPSPTTGTGSAVSFRWPYSPQRNMSQVVNTLQLHWPHKLVFVSVPDQHHPSLKFLVVMSSGVSLCSGVTKWSDTPNEEARISGHFSLGV